MVLPVDAPTSEAKGSGARYEWRTGRVEEPGGAYADFATLRGDPSDGLPGVAGVGDKTAAALVRTFGSVEAICEAIDKGHGGFPAGARAKLEAARDYLAVAPAVVRVATDAPVPDVDGGLIGGASLAAKDFIGIVKEAALAAAGTR